MGDAADALTDQGLHAASLHASGECDVEDPCQECHEEDADVLAENVAYERHQREEDLREALKRSMVALDDWLNTYAPEFCDESRVKEAGQRIMDEGGTLAYIADVQEQNRNALGEDV